MSNHLKLWDKVGKTDPAFTKQAKKGQYKFTAIAPMYQFKNATEVFGPQGLGWGVVIGSESFTEREYGETIVLSYDATMFYIYDGQRGEIPIHASEKSSYKTQGANGYQKVDEEARKKVVTNAKTKGLSELGFNADVFMGQFDDHIYLEAIGNEMALAKADNKAEEQARQDEVYQEWLETHLDTISKAASMNELKTVYNLCIRKANTRHDDAAVVKFTKAKDVRKGELDNG